MLVNVSRIYDTLFHLRSFTYFVAEERLSIFFSAALLGEDAGDENDNFELIVCRGLAGFGLFIFVVKFSANSPRCSGSRAGSREVPGCVSAPCEELSSRSLASALRTARVRGLFKLDDNSAGFIRSLIPKQ